MNLFTLFGLSVLLNAYIGVRLLPDLASFPPGQLVLASVLALCDLVMPLGLVARRVARPVLAGLLCMGRLLLSLLVLTLARDVPPGGGLA